MMPASTPAADLRLGGLGLGHLVGEVAAQERDWRTPYEANPSVEAAWAGQVIHGQCAELCGIGHDIMLFDVSIQSPADFKAWYDQKVAEAKASPPPPPSGEPGGSGAPPPQGGDTVNPWNGGQPPPPSAAPPPPPERAKSDPAPKPVARCTG